jgi:hypothetical protein
MKASLMDWNYNLVTTLPLPPEKGLADVIWYGGKAYGYYAHTVQLDQDGRPPAQETHPYREILGCTTLEALKGQVVYIAPFGAGKLEGSLGQPLSGAAEPARLPGEGFLKVDAFKETCDYCKAPFENIGHPRTGAVMIRKCKCEYEVQQIADGILWTMRKSPASNILMCSLRWSPPKDP